jgi:hypothetical protein
MLLASELIAGVRFRRRRRLHVFLSFLFALPSVSADAYTAVELYTATVPPNIVDVFPGPVATDGSMIGGAQLAGANFPQVPVYWASDGTFTLMNTFDFSHVSWLVPSQQVGWYQGAHAAIWSGTPNSRIDIHPPQLHFLETFAYGTNGAQQVGAGDFAYNGPTHAVLWNGTADSAVDLNPTNLVGLTNSSASATDGTHQVGFGWGPGIPNHAMLWSGTPDSAVDLHPTKLTAVLQSYAEGVGGGQQVGKGVVEADQYGEPIRTHALLWTGTPDSAVDLNSDPLGMVNSFATGTNGLVQIGHYSAPGFIAHAAAWSGTADSAVDLDQFLPYDVEAAYASAVDSSGNIFGTATDTNGVIHVVEWVAPEPQGLLLIGIGGLAFRRARRARRTQGKVPTPERVAGTFPSPLS